LIKAGVSRQREFLADASAVQFTRNPEGIGGALRKIAGLSKETGLGTRIEHPQASRCHTCSSRRTAELRARHVRDASAAMIACDESTGARSNRSPRRRMPWRWHWEV